MISDGGTMGGWSGERDRPERQQTLRAAIAWSYDLLLPREQKAFSNLSVFTGSFTLDAADAVCDADIETVAALVDHNLLVRHEQQVGEARFSLLETIREFAAEKLRERGDEGLLHRRHLG